MNDHHLADADAGGGMTTMYQETRARITEFLEQYVFPLPKSLTTDGYFSDAAIEFTIALLLDRDVFADEDDLKRQAIFIPDKLFHRARWKESGGAN